MKDADFFRYKIVKKHTGCSKTRNLKKIKLKRYNPYQIVALKPANEAEIFSSSTSAKKKWKSLWCRQTLAQHQFV